MDEISLLFALEAEELIKENKLDEAIELCGAGLRIYPDYAAAVTILAHAYSLRGDAEKANSIIKQYSRRIIHAGISRFRSRLNQQGKQSAVTDKFKDIVYDLQNAGEIPMYSFYVVSDKFSDKVSSNPDAHSDAKLMTNFYDYPANFKTVPKYKYKLKKSIFLEPDNFYLLDDISGLPVTETFADILIKQGNFRKAIKIISELVLSQQDKADYFSEKISKIEKLIKSNLQAFKKSSEF